MESQKNAAPVPTAQENQDGTHELLHLGEKKNGEG